MSSDPRRRRVLLITEGTYPYVVGGVTTWCRHLLHGLTDFDWRVLPIIASDASPEKRSELGPTTELLSPIRIWSDEPGPWSPGAWLPKGRDWTGLPGNLLRQLLDWEPDMYSLRRTLLWCRRNPGRIRSTFRSEAGWHSFQAAVADLAAERIPGVAPVPPLSDEAVAQLYQTLYWVARVASSPTPADTDLLHVTAAGWAILPAIAHQAEHGTPILLTEHGVYVREAYLASVRADPAPEARFLNNRLALGLARAAYDAAELVTPVTTANRSWEIALGVQPERIQVIENGVPVPDSPSPLPESDVVVSVGRIDPLKDVHTYLRTAREVIARRPTARFLHYGPVPEGQEAYAASCYALHHELGLGDTFRFMGSTKDACGVMRAADIVMLTSISEGLPIAALEAMSEGRPVVATAVGGCAEAVTGIGSTAPPGDHNRLADAVLTLLSQPALAATLGRRGHARLRRRYNLTRCLDEYRSVLEELSGTSRRVA